MGKVLLEMQKQAKSRKRSYHERDIKPKNPSPADANERTSYHRPTDGSNCPHYIQHCKPRSAVPKGNEIGDHDDGQGDRASGADALDYAACEEEVDCGCPAAEDGAEKKD